MFCSQVSLRTSLIDVEKRESHIVESLILNSHEALHLQMTTSLSEKPWVCGFLGARPGRLGLRTCSSATTYIII
ncbi:hypothetical protein GDO81_028162 [Engystomops pustulosus]|uniref:Uncharacterized protein n=1 Tax=Engystomops pustulosus TaxID=76066 RepID=A0AAV6YHJ9_ENGPU|nr:hypothetical protein GDO81_028162 [Engystomops pustulosus]